MRSSRDDRHVERAVRTHDVERVTIRVRLRHAHRVHAGGYQLVLVRVRAVVGGGVVSHRVHALHRGVIRDSRDVHGVRARVLGDDVAVRVERDDDEVHLRVRDDRGVLHGAASDQQRRRRGRSADGDVCVLDARSRRCA